MAIETLQALVAKATLLKTQSFSLAVGEGSLLWDTTPQDEDPAATGLVEELIRKAATAVEYATPDPDGTILAPVWDGTSQSKPFSVSVSPTRWLYLAFQLETTDVPTSVIRELGVYAGSSLMFVEMVRPKIIRSSSTRNLFQFIYKV